MPPKSKSAASAPASPAPAAPKPAAATAAAAPGPPSDTSAEVEHAPKYAYPLPHVPKSTIDNTQSLLRFVILAFICGAAVASRLFAVIRFESVIHEFDPWFN